MIFRFHMLVFGGVEVSFFFDGVGVVFFWVSYPPLSINKPFEGHVKSNRFPLTISANPSWKYIPWRDSGQEVMRPFCHRFQCSSLIESGMTCCVSTIYTFGEIYASAIALRFLDNSKKSWMKSQTFASYDMNIWDIRSIYTILPKKPCILRQLAGMPAWHTWQSAAAQSKVRICVRGPPGGVEGGGCGMDAACVMDVVDITSSIWDGITSTLVMFIYFQYKSIESTLKKIHGNGRFIDPWIGWLLCYNVGN